ncbi:hypothetical protein JVX93_03725 [Mycolicibacterium boenickei]|nr:hypothetical protein JVX93_03725 [Mycolicibacterium boenickei]
MTLDIQWDSSLLEEAAAIVEAEEIRLRQDEALWECELASPPVEGTAPRARPPRVGALTCTRRHTCPPIPDGPRRWITRPRLAVPVWATQRSPPYNPAAWY